jgi:CheY-like chemotaxis protein
VTDTPEPAAPEAAPAAAVPKATSAEAAAPEAATPPASTVIRLLLADDHPVVRAGLRAVLETEPDFEVVADVPTAEQAVELIGRLDVDVVLMDLQFGGRMLGSQATAAITARDGSPRVLVLTTYDTDADILAAICSRTPLRRSSRRRYVRPPPESPHWRRPSRCA